MSLRKPLITNSVEISEEGDVPDLRNSVELKAKEEQEQDKAQQQKVLERKLAESEQRTRESEQRTREAEEKAAKLEAEKLARRQRTEEKREKKKQERAQLEAAKAKLQAKKEQDSIELKDKRDDGDGKQEEKEEIVPDKQPPALNPDGPIKKVVKVENIHPEGPGPDEDPDEDPDKIIVEEFRNQPALFASEPYGYAQSFLQHVNSSAAGFVITSGINSYVQPMIPEPYGSMFTAGTFTFTVAAHNSFHALVKNQDPIRYLRAYGNTVIGFAHEAAKFTGGLITTTAFGYGIGQAVMHFGPVLAQSANQVAHAIHFAMNDPLISTAVIGFSAYVMSGALNRSYELVKPKPQIGPEDNRTLRYIQSVGHHLGLRIAEDFAAYKMFEAAMTSYGLGEVLANNPQFSFLFALAFDQLIAEPTSHLGHANKPIESLVVEQKPDQYTPVNQEEGAEDFDSELSVPTKSQQVTAVGWYGLRLMAISGVGYGILRGTEELSKYMGYQVDELSEAQQVARYTEVAMLTVVAERGLENFSGPLARGAMEGARYVGGSIKNCASMWSRMPSLPSMPRLGFGRANGPDQADDQPKLERRRLC